MTPAEFVAECRRLTKKTQSEFAGTLGVHKQTVSDWERGKFLPAIEMLVEIASAADLKLEDCLNVPVADPNDRDEKKLLRLFRSVSARRRADVLDYAEEQAQLQRLTRLQRNRNKDD